jgi:hypothetical protein
MIEELDSLWQSEYENELTSMKAKALVSQILMLRNSANPHEVSPLYKVLSRHDNCIALENILKLDWWKCENYKELYFALDAVADAFNKERAVPIPIWAHANALLSKYNGCESASTWYND